MFYNIENNLRELGYGDVAVNKKMKDLNKILYDILLKIENNDKETFSINDQLIFKYFKDLSDKNNSKYKYFERYFLDFYNFCFEQPIDNMIREALKFKTTYGSS